MLDMRKPYILTLHDRDNKLKFNNEFGIPTIAIKVRVGSCDDDKRIHLFYYDIGSERGHLLPGNIVKELENGIVFDADEPKWRFTLTELTYDDFNRRIRPTLDERLSAMLNDLDDVYVWYRKFVHMA